MERPIKFRAWDGARNAWLHEAKTPDMAIHLDGETIMFGELWRRPDDSSMTFEEMNQVLWMQYTELDDWHGKEVYVGDIVRFTYNERTAITEYSDEIVENMWDMRNHSWNDKSDYDDIEVIGNIYENPELL